MRQVDRRPGSRRARAFAPGHVTGLFAPAASGPDPRGRGSVGAGIVLERGAEATADWWPSGPRRLRVRSPETSDLPISTEVARRLWVPFGGSLDIEIAHGLPIGRGFGMSASGALATALAVARATGATRQHAIEVAHLAELFGGGGLGGVAAILGGGLEIRERPGVPPFGAVRHAPFVPSIFLSVAGRPLLSPPLLGDPMFLARVSAAAEEGLEYLGREPSVERFLVASERFTDRLALAAPPLRRTIRSMRNRDVAVAQAMFGRSLFAVAVSPPGRAHIERSLERAGLPAVELNAATRGAWARSLPP